MIELEEQCRSAIRQSGIDGRTSYFAIYLSAIGSIVQRLQDSTRLSPEQIERIMRGFVSHRYADYFERRARGLAQDCQPMQIVLSQGYKRGLKWRDVPLGKTCWDVAIYQQLMQELKPATLIEIGTGLGASALFFLDHSRMFSLNTKIITLDRNENDVSAEMRAEKAIEFVTGDVKNIRELLPVDRLRQLPHPWLIVEDCHEHVSLIVQYLEPLMATGDYLVVEDIGMSAAGSECISVALKAVAKRSLMVDTFYTDMFGRNLTCSPDSIFRRM